MSRPRRGLTLLETLLGLALLSVLMGLVVQNLRFAELADDLVEKLDVLQQLRLAELRLRAELETSTAILHPPPGDGAPVPGLVFAGPTNTLVAIYLDPRGNLKQKADGAPAQVLATGILALAVKQPIPGQVECVLKADSPDRGKLSFVIAAAVGNSPLGGGALP